VYGRRDRPERVPCGAVADASPPVEAPLPWRRRAARDTAGFLSPRVRRAAAERGVDASSLTGSGAGGRVTTADVLAATAATTAPAAPSAGGDATERIALNRVQQRGGVALLASKRTAAHAYAIVGARYDGVDAVRRARRDEWHAEEGFALTYLPFVARAVVDAIRAFPMMNATAGDDALVVHRDVHLGVAVDLAYQGLVVPVIRSADTRRLRGIARAIDDVAQRARAKRLVPDDLAGGTFTITNPGAAGTWMSFPIINQPQVGILSTDGVARRVIAVDDHLAISVTGYLCLAYDERVIDPPYAAAVLDRVAAMLETRDWSTEV
jgi:2-oxoglutarate dehydrogenase E2 component (dihydrolipoamide succinyltransferase)